MLADLTPDIAYSLSNASIIHNIQVPPPEVLLQTFSFLPVPSQVCFTLSCKCLYQLFSAVLQAYEPHYPWIFPDTKELPLRI